MNILYTSTAFPPSMGGAQMHLMKLIAQLRDRHDVRVLSFWNHNRTDWLLGTTIRLPDSDRAYAIDEINVQLLGLSKREKLRILPFVLSYYAIMPVASHSIANVIEQRMAPYLDNPTLIHNVRIGREPLSLASLTSARKRDIPFILTPVHHPRWKGWRYHVYDQIYREADALIALTHAEKQLLIEKGIQEDRVHLQGIGPLVSEQAFPEQFREKHNIYSRFILFLGQHYPYKGYQQLLQASKTIFEKEPDVHLVFIGPPVGRSEDIFTLYADSRIHRLGIVDIQEKTDALAACDVLCVPSTQESFGGVYTEAWFFGKPVVACNIPAVSEIIEDGVDGYLVKQNSTEISEKLLDLLIHPARAQQFGQAGQRKVMERYTWEKTAQQVEEIYRTVLA